LLIKDQETKDLISRLSFDSLKLSDLPSEEGDFVFTEKPFGYQEEFVRICKLKTRLLLAVQQGGGKSLGILWRLNNVYKAKNILVIGIYAVAESWRTDIREVFGEEASLYLNDAPGMKALHKQIEAGNIPKFLFCTYETAQKLKDLIPENYFNHIILDEAHLVSHEESRRFKAVEQIVFNHTKATVTALSGTPIQDKPRDLWGIMHLLNPQMAGSYKSWVARYEKVIKSYKHRYMLKTKNGQPIIDKTTGKPKWGEIEIPLIVETQNLDELHERLKSIMFRVTQSEFTTFKDTVKIVPITLTQNQRKTYKRVKEDILVELNERMLTVQNAAVRMLRLLQVSEGLFNLEKSIESSKLDFLMDYLEGTKEKVIVWSRFQEITNILGERFKDRGVVYNGDKSRNYKALARWAFNGISHPRDHEYYQELKKKTKGFTFEPGEAQFFFGVIDLRSAAGMNLHKMCHRQIFSSFSFMNAANMQAADRLRRIGQDAEEVFTLFLVGENTIEYKALTLVLDKYNTTLRILDGHESVGYKQTTELINLLKLERDD